MVIESYYGHKQGTTYAEIYSVARDGSERVVHRRFEDQEAYDTWHLAHYFKEILVLRGLLEAPAPALSEIPRKEKNLLLYLMLAAEPDHRRILELGSSLFELIDGLELMRHYAESGDSGLPLLDPTGFEYAGVELSALFRQAARTLHPGYAIDQVATATAFDGAADLLYDRSVANYAFETAGELAAFVKRAKAGLMNTLFSFDETFRSAKVGKTLTYFSLDEFLDSLCVPFFHLFGRVMPRPASGQDLSGGRSVLEGFFVFGDRGYVERFMAMSERDPAVKAYFAEKGIRPRDPRSLRPSAG